MPRKGPAPKRPPITDPVYASPLVTQLVLATQQGETERSREFMQQNLNAMAVKIGEMQAQLSRLDALGERLSALAGIKPGEFRFSETPGLGGAQSTSLPPQNLSLTQFNEQVAPAYELHHHDVVHFALNEVEKELAEDKLQEVITRLKQHLEDNKARRTQGS